jgi:AcrR family transcriptional regulator
VIQAALRDIPIEYRDRFRDLLGQPAEPADRLADEVRQYVATVRQVGARVRVLDLSVAERIADVSITLLETPDLSEDAALLVNTAVRYFVREEDDEEITGVLGFDDDVQVLNAVCRALRRDDLVIPFARPE